MSRHSNLPTLTALTKVVPKVGYPVSCNGFAIASTFGFAENTPLADTITDSANQFLKLGFKKGDKITVAGSTSNDGTYTVDTVAAGTLTLILSDDLTTEAAGDTVTISQATPRPYPVADGCKVIIKALLSNTGTIYIGSSSDNALSTSTNNFPLDVPMESVTLQVQDLSQIWLDASVAGEGVSILFES
jgi:hypothetical protein